MPTHTRASFAVLIGLNGLAGVVYSGMIVGNLTRHHAADLADRLGYGVVPFIAYAAMFVAAALFLTASQAGPDLLAAALVSLLVVNVRNAWDLALAMARRHGSRPDDPPGS